MNFTINLTLNPSAPFMGILAELNGKFSKWTDGSSDWADQTHDFLVNEKPIPKIDASVTGTGLSRRIRNDLLKVTIAMLNGHYDQVRQYFREDRFAFVIGYPRSGGSYLTKELLRTIGLNHTSVSEALAHDGFPNLRETWYENIGNTPRYHLQDSIFQLAEFLVISHYYYRIRSRIQKDGIWLIPKKMHKIVAWAGSLKMLLGQGQADYNVTLRHPVPTCISIYEKSGGLPKDGRFPAKAWRSTIEKWIIDDLMHLGYTQQAISEMDYFDAVRISWTMFHTRMATSGLFLGDRGEIQTIPYGRESLESAVKNYRQLYGHSDVPVETVMINDYTDRHREWQAKGDAVARTVRSSWAALGLKFPQLSND